VLPTQLLWSLLLQAGFMLYADDSLFLCLLPTEFAAMLLLLRSAGWLHVSRR
jgi:hypothetical protein